MGVQGAQNKAKDAVVLVQNLDRLKKVVFDIDLKRFTIRKWIFSVADNSEFKKLVCLNVCQGREKADQMLLVVIANLNL